MRKFNAVKISQRDNVVTAVMDIGQGQAVAFEDGISLVAQEFIKNGFKVAICDIPEGGVVVKYGEDIGVALTDIKTGMLVHIHNIRSNRGKELRR